VKDFHHFGDVSSTYWASFQPFRARHAQRQVPASQDYGVDVVFQAHLAFIVLSQVKRILVVARLGLGLHSVDFFLRQQEWINIVIIVVVIVVVAVGGGGATVFCAECRGGGRWTGLVKKAGNGRSIGQLGYGKVTEFLSGFLHQPLNQQVRVDY